jgi:hypothetical protein
VSAARAPRGGDHETFDELAVGWALHALEPEDEALFVRHLPDCARCARTVAETEEVMASLALDLPPAEPPPDLRERVRTAVERTEQHGGAGLPPDQPTEFPDDLADDLSDDVPEDIPGFPGPSVARPERPRPAAPNRVDRPRQVGRWRLDIPAVGVWRHKLPYLLGAAAAAAILALGAWNVVVSTARQQAETTVAEQSHIVDALLKPGQATIAQLSDSGGHGVATVVARHGQVQVVTWGLSVDNAPATTYVVWGMRQGSPVPLGTFDVVRTGMDLRTVRSSTTGLDGYSGYAVSIEAGRKAPSKPTDIVANGQVTS